MVYGAMESLVTLAQALRDELHAVEFIARSGRRFGAEVRNLGFIASEFPIRTKIDPVAIAAMARHFRSRHLQIVHTHLSTSTVNGSLAARLARVPCVATVHGMSGKLSFLAADRLIAVSNGVRDHLVAQGLDGRRIEVIHNGIPIPASLPDRAENRAAWGFSDSETVIGTVARTVTEKGYDDLLEAFASVVAQIPLARLLCVGDGPELERLRSRAAAMGIGRRVVWAGYRADVWSALAAMDLFAFASHKEAMGIAVVEALAAGLPVVSTDVGGLPEVLGNAGSLVPPHRPDRLGAAIVAAIEAETDSLRSERGRERAKSLFGRDRMRERTVDLYRALIQDRCS